MSDPFIGEIRMFGGNFAPAGWAFCSGQLMPISENDTLFTLIGTTYGGDGQETFGLPNLQSRVPMHSGTGSDGETYDLGESGGVETVTLTTQQIPIHTHTLLGTAGTGSQSGPANSILASSTVITPYGPETANQPMAANAIAQTGGSQPHENIQPYLTISFIISLFGIFPTPS